MIRDQDGSSLIVGALVLSYAQQSSHDLAERIGHEGRRPLAWLAWLK
jgi:hypothetical protein